MHESLILEFRDIWLAIPPRLLGVFFPLRAQRVKYGTDASVNLLVFSAAEFYVPKTPSYMHAINTSCRNYKLL